VTVLIIGASLVGSQIARLLVAQGERPVLFDHAPQHDALADIVDLSKATLVRGDILNPFDLVRVIRDAGVDRIVHLAANPMLTKGAQADPYGAARLNLMGTLNVLEAARLHRLGRVVVASSSALTEFLAGGEDAGDATKEEAFPRPTTIYAVCKQAKENLGLVYARSFGVEFVALRFASVAGPWRGRGGGGPSVAFREMVDRALAGEEAAVPARALEWVYVKDAAAAAVLALGAPRLDSRVFNIGMGRVLLPQDLVAALRQALPGVKARIAEDATAGPTDADVRPLDSRRARTELGFSPAYDMVAAIRDYVEWRQPCSPLGEPR
jgi:nucleoside-diphosphate-sugar epimerase